MLTRRHLLKVTGASPIALVGGTALLYSAPARGWVTVALAVIQAGFQLYQMSRAGGGGIGKLLAAQTEMLRAINEQLRDIGQTVSQIYAGVEQLKDMIDALPKEVSKEIFRAELSAMIDYSSKLLETGRINVVNRGLIDAVALDDGSSQRALERIGPAVSFVASDPSVANIPLMCLAWYTEYQLLTRLVTFNPARIKLTARMYEDYFASRIAALNVTLAGIESETRMLVESISTSPNFEGADCFEGIVYRMRQDACGHQGDNDCFSGYVQADRIRYSSTAEKQSDDLFQFLTAANDLDAAGVKISDALVSARVPQWSYARNQTKREFFRHDYEPPEYASYLNSVRSNACTRGRSVAVSSYYGNQEKLQQAVERLRLQTIVNQHLLLAASEAHRSCTVIGQRLVAMEM